MKVKIHLKTSNPERTITLEVDPTHSIAEIKKQIQRKTGVPPNQQRLLMELQDDRPLWNYNVKDECTVEMTRNPGNEMMMLYLKDRTGKVFTVRMRPKGTVNDLLKKACQVTEVPEGEVRLIFQGHQLEQGQRLSDYTITNGCILYIVHRLRGC